MKALVLNITNWISYHIADRLLNEGYSVEAMKNNDENEHLIDFFARNSTFELVDEPADGSYPLVICVGPQQTFSKEVEFERIIFLNSSSSTMGNATKIHVPYLFGEWMPMTEETFLHNGKRIIFSDPEFREDGLYIADFLETLVTWIENEPPFSEIYVQPERNRGKPGKKLEKTFFVEENVPIEENLKQVISHYHLFSDLYQQLD